MHLFIVCSSVVLIRPHRRRAAGGGPVDVQRQRCRDDLAPPAATATAAAAPIARSVGRRRGVPLPRIRDKHVGGERGQGRAAELVQARPKRAAVVQVDRQKALH